MFNWLKKPFDNFPFAQTVIEEITSDYSKKLNNLKINVTLSDHAAVYNINIIWDDKAHGKKMLPIKISYQTLANKEATEIIVGQIINVLEQEVKILTYKSDFGDFLV